MLFQREKANKSAEVNLKYENQNMKKRKKLNTLTYHHLIVFLVEVIFMGKERVSLKDSGGDKDYKANKS